MTLAVVSHALDATLLLERFHVGRESAAIGLAQAPAHLARHVHVDHGELLRVPLVELMQVAGGISVSWELTGYWNEVNLEQIAVWDPDIIIVPPYGGATVTAITDDDDWQILEAVQAGQVYQMPKLVAPWDTPAPDSVLGIIWLSQVFFPGLDGLDCSEQAEYFFNIFYDYAISAEELATICAID